MIFLAHISYYDEIAYKDKTDRVIFTCENSFVDAMNMIEDYYGRSLRSVKLLEPIGDANIITINKDIEEAIKDIDENGF